MFASGTSAELSTCDDVVDGVDGEVSLPVLQLEASVESDSAPSGSSGAHATSVGSATVSACVRSGVCTPVSRV